MRQSGNPAFFLENCLFLGGRSVKFPGCILKSRMSLYHVVSCCIVVSTHFLFLEYSMW